VLPVENVAERMRHDLVAHEAGVPCARQPKQARGAPEGFEQGPGVHGH